MTPVSVEQPSFDRKRILMTMDKVEMVLQLADVPESTTAKDQELPLELPFYPTDFKSEFYSAASMVLDREEIEALEKKAPSFRLKPVFVADTPERQ